ncbi:MAG: amino acid carrier protein [Psychroflexus sp.]|jgi:AGCS family alanine or glycine:cation symporter|nr:amino acid carrier protein [Psychroflexus sp.]MDR9448939.1 amino acid carrier protein [Psychroflexus sp.]
MIRFLISFCLLLMMCSAFAQELSVKVKKINPSPEIDNAQIELMVDGGVPPYQYKWSKQSTPLTSNKASDITEGYSYTVVVTDQAGSEVAKEITVKAESITEIFNGNAKPAVEFMSLVLFSDPFSAIGIYDPVVYTESNRIFAPGWEAKTQTKFKLEKYLVENKSHVEKGQDIAVIDREAMGKVTVKAQQSGKIEFLVDEGEYIYNPENKEHVIASNADMFAKIKYDEPIALTHPNGDPKKKNIPFIVVWLIFGAAFFTIRMGFINIRGFRHALDLAKGKYDDPEAPGRITHFQALSTAVSATVGLGNIAGVAVAISLGGAGATFWMILAGFLGMSSKFVECTLGVKYRYINKEGRIFGGPMNYLRYGLEKRNLNGLGKFLAVFFAILAVGASLGGGNMFQANQSFSVLSSQIPLLEGNGFYFGLILSILVGVVILGGISSIARVTGKVVPIMAVIYVLGAFTVIGINIENLGSAFGAIVDGAFSPSALKGGFIGVLVVGFQRAAFSNEAGVGSAAIAHSAAKTNHPPSEGFVALLEPFIDTVVVCTLTALVLIFTGMHEVEGVAGVTLTTKAFGSVISWFPIVLAIAVFLFAFSTMISWSYYGMRAWSYLFGRSKKTEVVYKVIFLVFVIIGASISLGAVLDFSDMMILAMSFPNIIGLYILSGEVRKDLKKYFEDVKADRLFKRDKK